MPELIVVAGANGSGKSSLTKLSALQLPVIDPDAIAREISPDLPESVALLAGREALNRSKEYMRSNSSFATETTLAGNTYLNLIREVKKLGWYASLIYVGIDDPETNIQRVKSRVKLGGHNVPTEDILRRYDRSLANLSKAAKIVDRLTLYDNSTNAGHQLVATIENNQTIIYMEELPRWVDRANLKLQT